MQKFALTAEISTKVAGEGYFFVFTRYNKLGLLLELLIVFSCRVIIGGDVNIHVHNANDADARRLRELLESFEMTQHVTAVTHNPGGTLDLVMMFAGCPLEAVIVDPAGILSIMNS